MFLIVADYKTKRNVVLIELDFDTCNVERTRSVNPKGIFVRATVVVSFHPKFTTKDARTFNVECFYDESADVTVDTRVTPDYRLANSFPELTCNLLLWQHLAAVI